MKTLLVLLVTLLMYAATVTAQVTQVPSPPTTAVPTPPFTRAVHPFTPTPTPAALKSPPMPFPVPKTTSTAVPMKKGHP